MITKLRDALRILIRHDTIKLVIAAIGVTVPIVSLVMTIPEFRCFFGLESKACPSSPADAPDMKLDAPVMPQPQITVDSVLHESQPVEHKPPVTPQQPRTVDYAIVENKSQLAEIANTVVSVTFQDIEGEEFVTLRIAPKGKKSLNKAVTGGETFEFQSATGSYLLQVLSIDYAGKKAEIQVSEDKIFSR